MMKDRDGNSYGPTEEELRRLEEDREVREMMNDQQHIEWQLGCSVREMQDFSGDVRTRQFINSLPGLRR